ncbi:hypothetical protein ACFX1X_024884 [Malus domestica]|uniref:Uncharacterized protein n=1 Tax=Malus domestica TaxID=3750 RepID=A0A498HCN9_MALDO|nr:hypothetical protein DVH24_027769 [Malus domestica]
MAFVWKKRYASLCSEFEEGGRRSVKSKGVNSKDSKCLVASDSSYGRHYPSVCNLESFWEFAYGGRDNADRVTPSEMIGESVTLSYKFEAHSVPFPTNCPINATNDGKINIVNLCRDLGLGPRGFYQPGYHNEAKLNLEMMCLGKNGDLETS